MHVSGETRDAGHFVGTAHEAVAVTTEVNIALLSIIDIGDA